MGFIRKYKEKNIALPVSSYALLLIFILVFWAIANTSFDKDYKNGIIEADAKGYYAYLPAVFIYHDLNFGFFDTIENNTYYNANLKYNYIRMHDNRVINKYYAGTAVCLLPFFVAGHVVTLATDHPVDGYSYYYTFFVHIGALFYLLLGLIGLQKLLRSFRVDESVTGIVLFAIVFGTNLFYYTVTEFAMSHLYSFTAITWFCYYTRQFFLTFPTRNLFYMAILLGIITLIRPVNILVILAVPFLAGSREALAEGFRRISGKRLAVSAALMCFILVCCVQLVIYKISTGSLWVYSYKEEGFNFAQPHIADFLFSYRKGLFVYTPLIFISLAGIVFLFMSSRFRFYTLLGFLFILVYIFSSWHMWFYGGSFSQRVMIEFYAFFAILLATAIMEIKNRNFKKLFIGLILLLVIFCQVQTYQYRRMQIHWSDMNREKYWEVFLRIDKL